jgi:hypothetical protein
MVNLLTRTKSAINGFRNPASAAPVPYLKPGIDEEKAYPVPLIWNMVAPGRYQWL